MKIEAKRYCADCGRENTQLRSLYCADCRPKHVCPDCNGTGKIEDDRGPGGKLLGPGDLGACERCEGEGELPPPLTEEQRANLIAKAEKATAALAGAGKLEGSQIERFAQLYRGDGVLKAAQCDRFVDIMADQLDDAQKIGLPPGVQVRPATDDEQRFALKVPREVLEGGSFTEHTTRAALESWYGGIVAEHSKSVPVVNEDGEQIGTAKQKIGQPDPDGVQVRRATDDEQRDAIAFSARFVPFKISKAELEGAEPKEGYADRLLREAFEHGFNPMRDLLAETITVDGKLKHRPQGFPVRRVDTCPHGAGRGAICEKCTAAAVPNRPLLILRMLEIAADLAEQAHRDELPGAPVLDCDFETGDSSMIPATLELLHRTLSALDMARSWATDRSICFAEHGPCACEKCSPTE